MHYRLSAVRPDSHFLTVVCTLRHLTGSTVELQLPAWRPGRYELQHFAKNIRQFVVFNGAGQPLPFRKVSKDRWLVDTGGADTVVAQYEYYAAVINAGSSFVSPDLLYVNPVNLCLYALDRLNEPCVLELDLPAGWRVACGLTQTGAASFSATDFYALADSPLLASATLRAVPFVVRNVAFRVWIEGPVSSFAPARIVADFSRFAETQMALFGEFPEPDYHFLVVLMPDAVYHGVEHRNSTVLVLGPHHEGEGLYQDLLGVSAHELFHAWNIVRIRPTELLPYDFTREQYFPTCFVAEGITTYYGDLTLRRAGVFSDGQYLKEVQVLIKRHFDNADQAVQSLTEASWDLWLDGYEKGIPGRKVSVYHKGAIVSLMLDLFLRRLTNHARSLDDVLRQLWHRFGRPFVGYTMDDYRAVVANVAGQPMDAYFDLCITGRVSLLPALNELLAFVALRVVVDEAGAARLAELTDPIGRAERSRWLTNGPAPVDLASGGIVPA
jgi:predicted metalloprotease with PDZ domain